MTVAFVIHPEDNVATLLDACDADQVVGLLGDFPEDSLPALEAIRPEHKVALCDISKGDSVIKYGMPIGHAVSAIKKGQWVHLHNCGSNYDERSNTLDSDSGAPTDTHYV